MEKSSQNYPLTTWRLIISNPQRGANNMSIDSAILAAVERGEVPPTLRLYGWNPPCLSLGYSQSFFDIDLPALNQRGWDLVRRPTGGRAILHTDELTYAVIGPKSDPRLEGGLMESYRRISEALYQSLRLLGLPVQVHAGKNPLAHHQPVCFENPSDFEITAAGKKIIGSAQARKKVGLLQHGALPLCGDLTRITEVLTYPTEELRELARETLLQKAVTVESALGKKISWEQAVQAFLLGFKSTLNLNWVECGLTPLEEEQTHQLLKDQFDNPEWTRQKKIKPEG